MSFKRSLSQLSNYLNQFAKISTVHSHSNRSLPGWQRSELRGLKITNNYWIRLRIIWRNMEGDDRPSEISNIPQIHSRIQSIIRMYNTFKSKLSINSSLCIRFGIWITCECSRLSSLFSLTGNWCVRRLKRKRPTVEISTLATRPK